MIPELFQLKGLTAWVTGGTKGLGLQMAGALAAAGANLALNSRHGDEAKSAARALAERHGVQTFGEAADVTREDAVHDFARRATETLGPIDILVCNAGINIRKPTVDQTAADWEQVVATNLTGPFLCSRAVIPGMMARRRGRIIHVASMVGLVGIAGRPSYTATKGALIVLAKTQALELAPHGITVNALCPGPFGTEMNKPLLEDPRKYAEFVARIPLGRWGDLPEIEGPILFLASHASSFMTGAALVIDGGWTAQ